MGTKTHSPPGDLTEAKPNYRNREFVLGIIVLKML